MKNIKNQSKIIAIAFVLLLTFAALSVALPIAGAQDDNEEVITYAYLSVAPHPVGVGQALYISMWLDKVPPTANVQYGDRWENLRVEVTKPDGSTQTLGPFTTDNIGGAYTVYYPTSVGTYNFQFFFPGQTIEGKNPAPTGTMNAFRVGDYYLPSNSPEIEVVVQEDPISPRPSSPLPTDDYWERPINGMNPEWQSIAGDWLNVDPGGNSFSEFTLGPESAHIMWTQQLAFAGVAGGDYADWNYYTGLAYETKFGSPIIMNGRLYHSLPFGTSGSGGGYQCVDLRTGEVLWYRADIQSMSFGQNFDFKSPNEFGIKPYLWAVSGGFFGFGPVSMDAYDPFTGEWLYTFENASSGTTTFGPDGELLVYVLNAQGNWLAMWNSTKAVLSYMSGGFNNIWTWRPQGLQMDWQMGVQWNVTINAYSGPSMQSIHRISDDVIVATTRASWAPADYAMVIGYSAVDGSELWAVNRTGPAGHIISWNTYQGMPAGEGVFVEFYPETSVFYGYDLNTGEKLWGPSEPLPDAFSIYTWHARIAYGKLFVPDYGGYVHAFDIDTGEKLWSYYLGDAGYDTPYGHYPIETPLIVADEKVYSSSGHGYSPPIFKGATLFGLDAETGDLIWDILFFGDRMGMAVADGYLISYNIYDGQVYCFGRGPSETTVTADPVVSDLGSSVMIRGTVTDQSTGAKGSPAIADEYMTEWMEYLYMQQPCPEYVEGVKVKLTAIDPNGNYQDIGYATADAAGNFGKSWVPPVPGEYHVTATFEGSASYGRSFDTTYFTVDEASPSAAIEPEPAAPEPEPLQAEQAAPEPTTVEPTEPEVTEVAEAPVISTEIAIIVAAVVVCVIGIVAFWMLRKRK